jgi:transposase-like protein
MAKPVLSAPQFQNEANAFAYVEARLWPNGPVCPHCSETSRIGRLNGKTTRPGLCKCYACQKPFTVRMGTLFEDSHLPLHLWLQVIHLMCASKKGIATRQIQRMLNCSMKTAWFLTHRIRFAMAPGGPLDPMGGAGEIVEADQTYIGKPDAAPKGRYKRPSGVGHKNAILTLVQRGGSARSFHVDGSAIRDVIPLVRKNISRESRINTDEAKPYKKIDKEFLSHDSVNHSADEYAKYPDVTLPSGQPYVIHTNTVEGYFSVFKRGMKGVYQHCKEKHLHRYLAEFDFRYSNRVRLGFNDVDRAEIALKGVKDKRLTYGTTRSAKA